MRLIEYIERWFLNRCQIEGSCLDGYDEERKKEKAKAKEEFK